MFILKNIFIGDIYKITIESPMRLTSIKLKKRIMGVIRGFGGRRSASAKRNYTVYNNVNASVFFNAEKRGFVLDPLCGVF